MSCNAPLRAFLLLILLVIPAVKAADLAVIQFIEGQAIYPLKNHVRYYLDTKRNLTIQDVINLSEEEFQNFPKETVNFGYLKADIWLKLTIENTLNEKQQLIFAIQYARFDRVEFHALENGVLQETMVGRDYPNHKKPLHYRNYAFPLTLPANTVSTFYLKIRSHLAITLPLLLSTEKHFNEYRLLDQTIIAFTCGVMIAMLFYNAFLFLSVRDISYLFYVLFISMIFCHQFEKLGLSVEIFSWHISLSSRRMEVFFPAAMLMGILFSRQFLQTRHHLPMVDKIFLTLALLTGIVSIIHIIHPIDSTIKIGTLISGFVFLFGIVVAIMRWVQGFQPAKYYLIAWTSIIIGAVVEILQSLAIIPTNALTRWSLQIGAVAESILLSFALAYRINSLKREKFISLEKATKAEAEAKAKTDFLAKMSHEIRTPMNGILAMADVLRGMKLPQQAKHYAKVIFQSGESLLTIINEILDHAKLDAGKLVLDREEFNLNDLINDCLIIYAVPAKNKSIYLHGRLSADVPNWIEGDKLRIRQILLNLLSNAIKFTPDNGEVYLSVSTLQKNLDPNTVTLKFSVKDSGVGIDASTKERIFQPFEQSGQTTFRQYGGTGLGLAISRQLVKLMHGEIGVESAVGEGANFWFTAILLRSKKPLPDFLVYLRDKKILLLDVDQKIYESFLEDAKICGFSLSFQTEISAENLLILEKSFDCIIINAAFLTAIDSWVVSALMDKNPAIIVLIDLGYSIDISSLIMANNALILEKPFTNRTLLLKLLEAFDSDKQKKLFEKTKLSAKKVKNQFPNYSVAVAEDNTTNQIVISTLLKKLKITPMIFSNGAELFQYYQANPKQFDMILMDCEMPVMDGYEATRAIRALQKQQQLPEIPIIALTAHALVDYQSKSVAVGMNDFLTKPIMMATLEKIIEKYAKQ